MPRLSNLSSGAYQSINHSVLMKKSQMNRSLDCSQISKTLNGSTPVKLHAHTDLKSTLQQFTNQLTSASNNRVRLKSKFKISTVTQSSMNTTTNQQHKAKKSISTRLGNYKLNSNLLHHNPSHEATLNQSALLHIVDDSTNVSRQAKKRNFTPGEGVRINNITALNQIVSNFSPNMLASKRDRRLKSPCNAHSSNFNSTLRQATREPAASQDPGKTRNQSRHMN